MPFDAARDLRWAWRHLQARGARGVFSVLLLAFALAANALVFAASDSLLFRPLPYAAFGMLSSVVAMAGVYAVMAFLVAARTREIGIRVALGVQRRTVQLLVVLSAVRMTALGAVAGLAAALGTSRLIHTQLFGLRTVEPGLTTVIFATTIVVAILAAWQPAWRATRIDPVAALRAE